MWAVVTGLSVLMWMWAAAGLHLVPLLEKGRHYPVRMAYAAVIIALGATLLLLLLWLILPGSSLSRGWTLKALESTQQLSMVLVLSTAVAALLRARLIFLPSLLSKPAPSRSAPPKPAQKKRRP